MQKRMALACCRIARRAANGLDDHALPRLDLHLDGKRHGVKQPPKLGSDRLGRRLAGLDECVVTTTGVGKVGEQLRIHAATKAKCGQRSSVTRAPW